MSFSRQVPPRHVRQTGTWQSRLVIDFVRDGVSETYYHNTLRLMPREILKQEYIRGITVHKCPLNDYQLPVPELLLLDACNHQFVILQTDNWWYSIEKNDHCIYMQRSEYIDDVLCYNGNICRRTPILGISYDCCQPEKTMDDLIQFLHDKNELNKRYNPILSNCQAFAKRIFDEFAKPKKHEIISGCSPAFQVTPPWQRVYSTVEGLLPSPIYSGVTFPSDCYSTNNIIHYNPSNIFARAQLV